MRDDLKFEGFKRKEFWIYGVAAPSCLIAVMAIAEWLETL